MPYQFKTNIMKPVKFTPKLIETEYSYEVKIPKLTSEQYLRFNKMISTTMLDDDTRAGHGDRTLLIKTCESFEYLEKTLGDILRIACTTPVELTEQVAIKDLPIGAKFVYKDSNFRVYIKTDLIQYEKMTGVYVSDGMKSKSQRIGLRPDLYVYPVDTEDDFLNYKR